MKKLQLVEEKPWNITQKTLADRFIVPPFSVFNTHQPYWKNRMLYWRELGFCGTNGRVSGANGLSYDNRRMNKNREVPVNGTSTFSPVLCEIVYKWFCTPCSRVFDPFAGGITRGAIAAVLGHNYVGTDINPAQVFDNYDLWQGLKEKYIFEGSADWSAIDCLKVNISDILNSDLIFTCPPYFNLEKYTDLEADLSNLTDYGTFLSKYQKVIKLCYTVLKNDRFMVWVVSDVRGKTTTEYYGLVSDTIQIARDAGFKLYNEIILYNETGNLAITSPDYINRVRKVGRQHQNILVFYKGNPKNIQKNFGEIQ